MPRKKSVSGRKRIPTAESRLKLQVDKINKRIKSLERHGNFGVYTGKTLTEYVSRSPFLSLKKARGSKRHRVLLKNLKQATMGQLKEMHVKFKRILGARTFTNIGIKNVREETRAKVKQTLTGIAGSELTDEDVDTFYELLSYKDNKILEQIQPSDFYALITEAQERDASLDDWVSMLSQFVDTNNKYIRKSAKDLYNKYVR